MQKERKNSLNAWDTRLMLNIYTNWKVKIKNKLILRLKHSGMRTPRQLDISIWPHVWMRENKKMYFTFEL